MLEEMLTHKMTIEARKAWVMLNGRHQGSQKDGSFPVRSNERHDQRVHHIDNLRLAMTTLLVLHHSAVEIIHATDPVRHSGRSKLEVVALNIFAMTNKPLLWALFFFLSGYSMSLSLSSNTSEFRTFLSRSLKIGLPALIYTKYVQIHLFRSFAVGSRGIFHDVDASWLYTRLSGPIPYVIILLSMDYVYLFLRYAQKRMGNIIGVLGLTTAVLLTVRSLGIDIASISNPILQNSCDYPGPVAPLSFVAYIAGVHFEAFEEYLPSTKTLAIFSACLSASYLSMGIAYNLSPTISSFIDAQYKEGLPYLPSAARYFYLILNIFVFYILSLSAITLFCRAEWAREKLPHIMTPIRRTTYFQVYFHIIPISTAVRFTRAIRGSPLARFLVVSFIGVVVTWTVVWCWWLLLNFVAKVAREKTGFFSAIAKSWEQFTKRYSYDRDANIIQDKRTSR
ncbi:hypothetical protein D9613_009618 [Agrocybe pediades]|uniref:Acyltransferase 3 domain-containing protein n=1 Tax=Agrocybe pediades TaxID=84607 RepID=A0A8H4R595_9AGAR|nr:hypothetical protein D9613_009618 [Agrocybe pediades]